MRAIQVLHNLVAFATIVAGQVLKYRRFFIFVGVEMVIGWIRSHDPFETS